MEKYGFVYIWRDRKHKRYYVGCHWGHEDDGYICSSPWMKQAYKHRPDDFKRRILKRVYSTRLDLLAEENRFLSMIKPEEIKVRYYNLQAHQFGHWSMYPDKVKTISEKISYKTKEAMSRPEVRRAYLKGMKTRNNIQSEEWLGKRSVAMKEVWKNPEYKKLLSETAKLRLSTPTSKAARTKMMKTIWTNSEYKKMHSDRMKANNPNHIKETCPHCHKIGPKPAMRRHHFDRCKAA